MSAKRFRRWQCQVCGWIYDEAKGDPESGLEPGTRWKDVPHEWICPDCSAAKADFVMVELAVELTGIDTTVSATNDRAADIVLGSNTLEFEIDATMREIRSREETLAYRSVVVRTGSDSRPAPRAKSDISDLKPSELILDDGLQAPIAIDASRENPWADLKAWWWGA